MLYEIVFYMRIQAAIDESGKGNQGDNDGYESDKQVKGNP